jgi:hypothetical protein
VDAISLRTQIVLEFERPFKTVKQKDIDCPRRGRNNRQPLREAPRFLIREAGLRFGGNARGLTPRVREKRETRAMLRLRLFVAW